MDDERFSGAFGTEWFIRHGATRLDGDPFVTHII
jgi:hypothetical protein